MRILAVSPHLDDAVFSAGGTLAGLVQRGHEVTVVTCFTATVPRPVGFALQCQTDKGLAPGVDYMALRRQEDLRAAAALGVAAVHLPLPEAPHRGYRSAPALFGGPRTDDVVHRDVLAQLRPLDADVVFGPQGRGAHVDHLQVVLALTQLGQPTVWWADAPYSWRSDSLPPTGLPEGLTPLRLPCDEHVRLTGSLCYTTQLDFQVGGSGRLAAEFTAHPEQFVADSGAQALIGDG